jgi:hypothetical protein
MGIALAGVSPTWSAFKVSAANPGNTFTSAPDFVAPSVGTTVIVKNEGGVPGYIRKGGVYRVMADITDTGNPASGISTATTNVATITSGQTAASLASGSFSAGGVSYTRATANLTAGASLTAGTYTYSITSTDVAANVRTQTGYTVVVDNTAPTASDVQTANTSGGTVGRPQAGDTITFTFSEPIDPQSILAGWTGASSNVVVAIADGGGLLGLGGDALTIRNNANSGTLPFGSVDLGRGDYRVTTLGLGGPISFGKSGAAQRSTMVMTGNQVVVTLGTPDDTADTAGGNGTMSWGPIGTPYDRAANVMTTGSATESGAADKEF